MLRYESINKSFQDEALINLSLFYLTNAEIIAILNSACSASLIKYQMSPVHEKFNNLGFRPGPTQTRLYSDSIKLEA